MMEDDPFSSDPIEPTGVESFQAPLPSTTTPPLSTRSARDAQERDIVHARVIGPGEEGRSAVGQRAHTGTHLTSSVSAPPPPSLTPIVTSAPGPASDTHHSAFERVGASRERESRMTQSESRQRFAGLGKGRRGLSVGSGGVGSQSILGPNHTFMQ